MLRVLDVVRDLEDRRHRNAQYSQQQQAEAQRLRLMGVLLLRVLDAADEEGAAEHEQQIRQDRAEQTDLHDAQHAAEQRDERHDQLRHVAKGRVQKAADRLRRVHRELLRDETDALSHGRDRQHRENEDRHVIPAVVVAIVCEWRAEQEPIHGALPWVEKLVEGVGEVRTEAVGKRIVGLLLLLGLVVIIIVALLLVLRSRAVPSRTVAVRKRIVGLLRLGLVVIVSITPLLLVIRSRAVSSCGHRSGYCLRGGHLAQSHHALLGLSDAFLSSLRLAFRRLQAAHCRLKALAHREKSKFGIVRIASRTSAESERVLDEGGTWNRSIGPVSS